MENNNNSRFQILCLSGGGYLGLYSAIILAELEKRTKKPIANHFDLIAGTSIGGIIALALSLEIPAEKIVTEFVSKGKLIFSSRPKSQGLAVCIDLLRSCTKAKYSQENLRNVIDNIIGKDILLSDAKHPVIVPAVNLTSGKPRLFKTSHHPKLTIDSELKVTDIALATSAAPTFFPLAEINEQLYADGGLFANSPDLLALHEAECYMNVQKQNIHILSIGTTTARYTLPHTVGRNLGWFGWAKKERLLSAIISSQQQSTDFILQRSLGDRYYRIDTELSKEQTEILGLDIANINAIKEIKGIALDKLQYALGQDALNPFLQHQSKPEIFLKIKN